MGNKELIDLMEELTAIPAETEWVEFKMVKGSLIDEQIGEYISVMSNGATVTNNPFGYLVRGVGKILKNEGDNKLSHYIFR
jgi:ATP-dependent DNA helicase RecG